MRIVFGITTAREPLDAVVQLVDALGPRHRILIHHDFTQQAYFRIDRPNVHVMPDFRPTQWGGWSYVQAIRALMRCALREGPFDYFQLLSGSCLPIKPVATFEEHLRRSRSDADIDLIDLTSDREAALSHGFRVFAPARSLRHRLMRRVRDGYLGPRPRIAQRASLGIASPHGDAQDAEGGMIGNVVARTCAALVRASVDAPLAAHPLWRRWRPHIASTWFGCRADVCRSLVERDPQDELERYVRRLHLCDEIYFATVIGSSGLRVGPSNHHVSPFRGPHPRPLEAADLPALARSPRFFARKFVPDPTATLRATVVQRLAARPLRQAAGTGPAEDPRENAGLAQNGPAAPFAAAGVPG